MKSRQVFSFRVGVLLVVIAALSLAYSQRRQVIDLVQSATKPAVPLAQPASEFVKTVTTTSLVKTTTTPKNVVGVLPKTTPKNVATSTTVSVSSLPSTMNLAVPFALQAPYQNWEQPYEDGCEEASTIMVDAFYRGVTFSGPADIDTQLKRVFAWEDEHFGSNQDTTAEQTARMIRELFGYKKVEVVKNFTTDQLRRVLAEGHPVILPANGKMLKNPNFKNGGPMYHMLVVKGYLDGKFITNDPGTRKGADYLYSVDTIMNAAHDWNGGDTAHGEKVMIVVYPNK